MCENDPSKNLPLSSSSYVELEEKLMFQQRAFDELNGVVLQQQAELVRLSRELHSLRSAVQQLHENSQGENPPQEKPPHY